MKHTLSSHVICLLKSISIKKRKTNIQTMDKNYEKFIIMLE